MRRMHPAKGITLEMITSVILTFKILLILSFCQNCRRKRKRTIIRLTQNVSLLKVKFLILCCWKPATSVIGDALDYAMKHIVHRT